MYALVTGGKIAAGCGHGSPLRALCGYDFDHCTDSIAVTFVAYQLQCQPVVRRFRFVANHVSGPIVSGDDGVDAAVVIDVAGSQTAARPSFVKNATRSRGNIRKAVAGVAREQHRLAIVNLRAGELDGVEVVPLRYEEILPAVVIVVD